METDVAQTEKTPIPLPRGTGTQWWKQLSTTQKRALVYPRLKAKEHNKVIAADLGVTPNSIASLRNKWNNEGKPDPYRAVLLEPEDYARQFALAPTASEDMPSAAPVVLNEAPPPESVEILLTPMPEEPLAEPTPDEVSAVTRSAIEAAAREQHTEELAPEEPEEEKPRQTLPKVSRQRFLAEVVDPDACRCPVAGKSFGTALCGAKPVVAYGCCEEHAKRLFGWKPRE